MSIFGKGMGGRRYHQLHNGIKTCWMCDGLLLITWVIDYWYMDVFIDEQFFRESREKVWMFSILVSWLWIPIVIPEYIKFYQLRFKFEFLGRSALWLVEERRGGGGWEREVRWLAQSPVSSQGARTERRTALQYRHLITSQRETTDKVILDWRIVEPTTLTHPIIWKENTLFWSLFWGNKWGFWLVIKKIDSYLSPIVYTSLDCSFTPRHRHDW